MESKVILTRNPKILTPGGRVNKQVAVHMIHKGLMALTGKSSASIAWRSLFGPDDEVGIKVNCLSGAMMSTHPVLVSAILEGLRLADVSEEKILIWDRTNSDLTKAGFTINMKGRGVEVFWNRCGWIRRRTRDKGIYWKLF